MFLVFYNSLQTGIRSTHQQFEGRVKQSKDFSDEGDAGDDGDDLNGHGTHVVRTCLSGVEKHVYSKVCPIYRSMCTRILTAVYVLFFSYPVLSTGWNSRREKVWSGCKGERKGQT
jgi:hypothetical protein